MFIVLLFYSLTVFSKTPMLKKGCIPSQINTSLMSEGVQWKSVTSPSGEHSFALGTRLPDDPETWPTIDLRAHHQAN